MTALFAATAADPEPIRRRSRASRRPANAARVDLYAPIHKALRSIMTRHAGALGRLDVARRRGDAPRRWPSSRSCSTCAPATSATRTTSSTPPSRPACRPGPSASPTTTSSTSQHRGAAGRKRGAAARPPAATRRRSHCACIATSRCSSPRTSSTCTSRRRSTTPCCGRCYSDAELHGASTTACWRSIPPQEHLRSRAGWCRR